MFPPLCLPFFPSVRNNDHIFCCALNGSTAFFQVDATSHFIQNAGILGK